jgi:MIP family channel proteins
LPQKGLYGSTLSANHVRNGLTEFVGTFFLVAIGTGVAIETALEKPIAGGTAGTLGIALAFGLVLVVLVNVFGHVSGGHFNPAVTLSLASTGQFPWATVPIYVLAQLIGATSASLGWWAVLGSEARTTAKLGATYPTGISAGAALAVEAVVTFLLVITIMSVATDERADPATTGLSIGLALGMGVLAAGPVTGGSLNPARTLGPMVVAADFTDWWVYILGPIVGGVAAAFLYQSQFKRAVPPEESVVGRDADTTVTDPAR